MSFADGDHKRIFCPECGGFLSIQRISQKYPRKARCKNRECILYKEEQYIPIPNMDIIDGKRVIRHGVGNSDTTADLR